MGSEDKSRSGFNGKLEIETTSSSAKEPMAFNSPLTHNSSNLSNAHFQSPPVFTRDLHRAIDLLVSVSVYSELYKPKIIDLASKAIEELTQKAFEREPLWTFDEEERTEVLNDVEYKRRFGPLDATLEEIIRMITVGVPMELPDLNGEAGNEPTLPVEKGQLPLQTEASRATGMVFMHPISLVDMLMDVEQWSMVFSNIVTQATVLGVLSTGELGNPNGALQVMTAEFHVPSPLVQTREIYFARCCKQLDANDWVVVDVSLESIFPYPVIRCQRRPSGCLIQGIQNGFSRVIWIEHNEVDNISLRNMFKPLLNSGFAFTAKRWVATLQRECDRLKVLMQDNIVLEGGRKSLLELAQRMSRSYNAAVSGSAENTWRPLPIRNTEDMLVRSSYYEDDQGSPHGITVTVATSIWLNVPAKIVFEFLRHGGSRDKWDILSYGCVTRDLAHFATGRDPSNRVSIVLVEATPNKPMMLYLQESYTDSTAYYIFHAPIDLLTMNAILNGGSPGRVTLLPSGFTVLPDRPTNLGEDKNGSILTIGFQVVDQQLSSPEYLPPQTVAIIYGLLTKTISMIKAALISEDD